MSLYLMQISPRMWSLWPLLYKAFSEWAMEYLDNILLPLNNFISKGTQVFLACKSPDYLAQVLLAIQAYQVLFYLPSIATVHVL